jgi:predicted transcriptional regulator YdeE
MPTTFEEPQVIEFGPRRAIGLTYQGKNENGEIPALWHEEFMPRMAEVPAPEGVSEAYGICRCLPGVTDGSFEYIAAKAAVPDAPMPAGMTEVALPAGRYLAFKIPSLAQIFAAWDFTRQWCAVHPEFELYCGPGGCDCTTHPGFEYYPPDFNGQNELYLYLPVK